MVPLRQGEHALPGVSLSVEEGVRFRRDFFGGRRATQVRSWRAQDQGRVLVVTAIPGQEQPPSFGGAIGHGFTLEVSADRTVVQVGDPITLSLVLRGEGLETASLPALDAEGLLPSDGFRIPADVPTGELDGDAKHFTAVVRVLDDRQTEIPALAYTWFDPDAKRYETTYSRPIALSVRAAEVIGARDVLRGEPAEDGPRFASDDQGSGSAASALTGSLALTGADLAIATDPGAVLGRRSQGVDAWAVPTLYASSLSLVAAALLDRRRRRVDPELSRRRRLLLGELSRVRAAGAQPPAEAAREIAAALRAMLRMVPEATSLELDELLGKCDARSFAPSGADAPLEEALAEKAVALAESLASQGASR
jgi:hypothetical protein